MSEFGFVLKVFFFSVVVIALMQIRIGDHNIEQHSQNWLHSSSLVHTLNVVSLGAHKAITNGYHFVRSKMDTAMGNKNAASAKKAEAITSYHGIEIRHRLHQSSTAVEDGADSIADDIKSER